MTISAPELYEKLKDPTQGLHPSRRRFAAFYDDWLADRRSQNAPAGFIHAVVSAHAACGARAHPPDPAGPDPADNGDAMRLAVAALADKTDAFACLSAALGAGLFDANAKPLTAAAFQQKTARKLLETLQEDGPRAILQATATPHAITNDREFWTDLGHLLPAIMFARRRLCLIEAQNDIGGPTVGSGFLVGPSIVLTNLHVVNHLDRTIGAYDKDLLIVKFDYSETTSLKNDAASEYTVLDDWMYAEGALGDELRAETGQDYWWNTDSERKRFMADVAETPDFALIRLDGSPGLQRGWYDIAKASRREPTGVWALHHPLANDQTISRGYVPLNSGRGAARLFHSASTAIGSSGGLLLNQSGEPTALHYLGLEVTQKVDGKENSQINLAIPLHHIAERLRKLNLLESLETPHQIGPFKSCIDGRRPVFGRKAFLRHLNDLWTGEIRIMRIFVSETTRPMIKPGKSFSAEIIRSIFSGPEHHHILFRAGDVKVDAYRVAQDAVRSFAEDLVADIPERPVTTSPAYVRELVEFFATAIQDRLANKHVWITLDDLDRHDLSDASGREFLAALYGQVAHLPNLRIVLIGLNDTVTIAGMTQRDYISSAITSAELDNLNRDLAIWLQERGFNNYGITPPISELFAEVLISLAGDAPTLMDVAGVVTDHVADIADARLGAAVGPEGAE